MRRLVAAVLVVLGSLALVAGPASAAGRTVVIFVGGIKSSLFTSNWDALQASLAGRGYRPNDYFTYSYSYMHVDPPAPNTMMSDGYSWADTCQPLSQSEANLAWMLTYMQANGWAQHAIVVAHSLGATVAFETLIANPGFVNQGFVTGLATVDGTLRGMGPGADILAGGVIGSCPSADTVYANGTSSAYQTWVGSSTQWLAQRTTFVDVVNPSDTVVDQRFQVLPTNHMVNWSEQGGTISGNHNALFYDAGRMAQLAGMLPAQGS